MSEFKVGLLALSAIASVIFMSLKITSNQSGFGDYLTYRTVVRDAAGIFPKTPIKIAGINVGRIKAINLQKNEAMIEFEILEDVKVTRDSVLKIKSVGFLGDKYLEVVVGDSAERLQENEYIPSSVGGGMEEITKDASEVLSDLKAIMASIKKSLAPGDRIPPLEVISQNIIKITDDVKAVTSSLKRIVGDNESRLNNTIANIEELTESLSYHTDMNQQASLMSDLKKVGPIMDNVNSATEDLKAILADLRQGKGTVGKLLRDEQVIDQVEQTLSGVQRMVGQVNNIQTELMIFSSANTEFDSRTDLNLNIYPAPERFYRVGIATMKYGPLSRSIITEDVNGSTTVTTRTEQNRDDIGFNVQMGRRLNNWSFRAGLIESSGGLGVDYYIRSWGTNLTMEIFDYQEDLGPNVRLLTQIHLWNVFYLNLGGEDLISKNNEESFTFGAGLRFTDEDLKSLIGLLI